MKDSQTTQEALNAALKEAQAWKAAALAVNAERDALTAMVEALKTAYKDLCGAINDLDDTETDSEEVIDEMWGQVFSVMQDGWNSLSREPKQHLAEIRAEAGRAGFIAGFNKWLENQENYKIRQFADEYAEQIRQGGAK